MPTLQGFFPRKSCSFSSVRGTHQWSIVSVCCDQIALPHGRYKAAEITLWNYGKSGKTIHLRNSIVMGYYETLQYAAYYRKRL